MPLSWNEIKTRASSFSKEWKDTRREEADAKPFLIDFLNIFGISQKRVATFEHRVRKIDEASGYIDLLWPGTLLVEMKSRGQDLDKAYLQAKNYCHGLKEHELPKLIMICDFLYFHIYREDGLTIKFELSQLLDNLQIFEELAGYQKRNYHEEDPVNIAAAELMGKLHDQLKDVGYTGTPLEAYLVRLLFILFADDTTIFQKGIFFDYIEQRTKEDGSDLAMHLDQLFQVLDIPEDKRLKTLDEQLNLFPYVNGSLFSERLPTAAFNSKMRQILIDCCKLDWGKISPAIFGSLFQSVMDSTARRNLGAHYTSEKNILKLIKPLFLDQLWDEFHESGENQNKLKDLHKKISKLRFLDPACGCGNFLITAYRELRYLELAIVEKLLKGQLVTNINQYFLIDLDQFYGIELGEFPSQIAQVAMFLIDHQCNMAVSDRFGEYIPLIPLQNSAVILNDNALRVDWQSIIKPFEGETGEARYDYIFGNPPFIGRPFRNEIQRYEHDLLTKNIAQGGDLDYVVNWFLLAAQYLRKYQTTEFAFVATNSICQGVQMSLWSEILNKFKLKIKFAYKSFIWTNDASGKAAVHCVIIGLSFTDNKQKKLYIIDENNKEHLELLVPNISPYLIPGSDIIIPSTPQPISAKKNMVLGSQPTDDGNFMFTEEEKIEFLKREPEAVIYFRQIVGSAEFINNIKRYCLWLVNAKPEDLKRMPIVLERIEAVRKFRSSSKKAATREDANKPAIFQAVRHIDSEYLLIPRVSSESRKYVPIGFLNHTIISTDANYIVPNASLWEFGILTSIMHNVWMRLTAGKLKSDYRYSSRLVYNTYPWPEAPTEKQRQTVEELAKGVLDARAQFPESSLADLYDPNTMPLGLIKAHQNLDKAVDQCYRLQPFISETKRIEFLFELYEKYTTGMFVEDKSKNNKKKSK